MSNDEKHLLTSLNTYVNDSLVQNLFSSLSNQTPAKSIDPVLSFVKREYVRYQVTNKRNGLTKQSATELAKYFDKSEWIQQIQECFQSNRIPQFPLSHLEMSNRCEELLPGQSTQLKCDYLFILFRSRDVLPFF